MPVQKSFSGSSPADPAAAESSFPRAMPLLMAGTNFAMSAQGDGQSMTNHPEQTTGNAHEHRQH